MAASSLLLPTSIPKTLLSIALTLSSSSPSKPFAFTAPLPGLTSPFPLSITARRGPARAVVPRVAVQSEYGRGDLEELEEEEEESANFSVDLKVFVGNLPFNVDSAELAGLFERVGNVEMVEVIYDKLTGKSRGFGFVTMSTTDEVEAAVEQFNGYELKGRSLRVNCGPPPPKDEFSPRGSRTGGGFDAPNRGGGFDAPNRGGGFDSPNRVYVGNLPWSVDNFALETLFNEHGKVMEAKVVFDRESGRSKGFGFVTFSSANEVNNAISSLDGYDIDGRSIRVTVAESRPRR